MRRTKKWLAIIMAAAVVASGVGTTQLGTVAAYAAVAADDVVEVTTSNTTEAIGYASLQDAIDATNVSANAKTKAKIVVTKDITLKADITGVITIPLTIEIADGVTVTGVDYITNLSEGTGICKKVSYDKDNVLTAITFAEHKPTYVCSWAINPSATGDEDKWYVESIKENCDNCGITEHVVAGAIGYTYDKDKDLYTYTEKDAAGKIIIQDTHSGDAVATGYILKNDADPSFVVVNGFIQHANGLPVVSAPLVDNNSGASVDPTITVTEATKKEINDALAEGNITAGNTDATCTEPGAIVYKVVVSDPDGNILKTKYLRDYQAVAKTEHSIGALHGYKILKKSETKPNTGLVKTTTEGKKTYYWSWGEEKTLATFDGSVANTTTGSINDTEKSFGLTKDNIADDGSFTYLPIYFCDSEKAVAGANLVEGEAVTVNPYANAADSSQNEKPGYSTCTAWKYPKVAFTYSFTKNSTDKVKTTYTYTINTVEEQPKPDTKYSHVSDGTKYNVIEQPTCADEGTAAVVCSICGKGAEDDNSITVKIPKVADTFATYTGSTPLATEIDDKAKFKDSQVVTLSNDGTGTEATVAATCTLAGGVYKYCDGTNNVHSGKAVPHWVKQSSLEATGHDLSDIVTGRTWKAYDADGVEIIGANAFAYNSSYDYTCEVVQQCKNAGCPGQTVVYHSKKGKDGIQDDSKLHVYSAIDVVNPTKGKDCQSYPVVTYTVKGIKDTVGNDVVNTYTNTSGQKGDHAYVVDKWHWSSDYTAATADVKCSIDPTAAGGSTTVSAKVTQATEANGITTFTATYGDKTDTKKVYTLKGAKVAFDTSGITDGNLVNGITGYAAPQNPEVTVTLNGTVINSDLYDTTWTWNKTKGAIATVTWTKDVRESDDAEHSVAADANSVASKGFNVAAKKTFVVETSALDQDGDDSYNPGTNVVAEDYDPAFTYTISAKATNVKDATVKYAITSKAVTATTNEVNAGVTTQKKIEALSFDQDSVVLHDAGTFYVYAQISADGYTTYTANIANVTIDKKTATVYIDNATVVEGDTPNLHIRAVDTYNEELNIDPKDFTITTAGGESIENLKAGTYRLRVTADNYRIKTSESSYVATLTVLAKDDSTVEEQAKAESVVAAIDSLNDSSSAADIAAARAAYNALSDTAKARVDADVLKKLTALEQKNTDATDKAAAQAVIDQLAKITSSTSAADAKKAVDAYNALTAKQKAIVDANSTAKANLTKAQETAKSGSTTTKTTLKKSKITTVKLAKKTFKASALKKKKATTKIKVTKKTGNGKITYKKLKGSSKKITVSKAGKITVKKGTKKGTYKVKVKVTMAKTSKYKKATKTVTLKIKVK